MERSHDSRRLAGHEDNDALCNSCRYRQSIARNSPYRHQVVLARKHWNTFQFMRYDITISLRVNNDRRHRAGIPAINVVLL